MSGPVTSAAPAPPRCPAAVGRGPTWRTGAGLAPEVVRACLVVRLGCLLVALLGYADEAPTAGSLVAVVALAASGGVLLLLPRALDVVVRHPMLVLVDVVAVVVVLLGLGPESPLVLATYATALMVGVLLPPRSSAVLVAVLVAGCWAAQARSTGDPDALAVVAGTPAVYVLLGVLGAAVRRGAEDQVRAQEAMAAALASSAASAERTRVAREVHDSLAASLQGLALGLAALPAWVRRDPEAAGRRAEALAASAGDTVELARGLMTRLRLDPGPRPASQVVLTVVREWEDRCGRRVEVDAPDVGPLGPAQHPEVAAALHEVLENVARHAGRCRVRVVLDRRGEDLLLRVEDDGTGVDLAQVPQREAAGHYGLRGLGERMALLDGSAEVESAPGAGTRVVLRWPAPRASVGESLEGAA